MIESLSALSASVAVERGAEFFLTITDATISSEEAPIPNDAGVDEAGAEMTCENQKCSLKV